MVRKGDNEDVGFVFHRSSSSSSSSSCSSRIRHYSLTTTQHLFSIKQKAVKEREKLTTSNQTEKITKYLQSGGMKRNNSYIENPHTHQGERRLLKATLQGTHVLGVVNEHHEEPLLYL